MIRLPERVLFALEPVNLGLSFDRLAGIVQASLGEDPRDALLVVFHNRRRTHLKMIWYDGRGFAIIYKRLDQGRFRVPVPGTSGGSKVSMTRAELSRLFEGVDVRLLRTREFVRNCEQLIKSADDNLLSRGRPDLPALHRTEE